MNAIRTRSQRALPQSTHLRTFKQQSLRLSSLPGEALCKASCRSDPVFAQEIKSALEGHCIKQERPEQGPHFLRLTPCTSGSAACASAGPNKRGRPAVLPACARGDC